MTDEPFSASDQVSARFADRILHTHLVGPATWAGRHHGDVAAAYDRNICQD